MSLESAGHKVESATTFEEALAAVERSGFDVIVIGTVIAAEHRERLIGSAKSRRAGAKIVMLYRGAISRTERADAIISADDAQLLLETLGDFQANRQISKSKTECA